jgi:small multidrug resistance pump
VGLGPIPYWFAGSNPAPRTTIYKKHPPHSFDIFRHGGFNMNTWFYLGIAILSEVMATASLKSTEGFTKIGPSLLVLIGYSAAFYFLSLTLEDIPIGVAYAVWSGVGVATITIVSVVFMDQKIDLAGVLGIGLIVVGVIVLRLFSGSSVEA